MRQDQQPQDPAPTPGIPVIAHAATPPHLAQEVAIGGVEVLLNSRRTQGFSTEMFTAFGVDLSSRRIVVTKSSQHFHASFSRIAARIVYLDAPGTLTADLTTLPFRKARAEVVASF